MNNPGMAAYKASEAYIEAAIKLRKLEQQRRDLQNDLNALVQPIMHAEAEEKIARKALLDVVCPL